MVSDVLVEVPSGYRAGGWEVLSRIASGSWASVYEARRVQPPRAPQDPPRNARAALKFLPGGTLSPPQYAGLREAVREEVRFHEQADHPRLIRTFETFVVDDPEQAAVHGSVVLAMERAERSLQDVLDDAQPPGLVDGAQRLIGEICEALAHMHALGWVHGDLKPANVLLMGDGSVRLADFGLARELEGTHAYAPRLGSSDFLPPEWWSERIGERGIATRTTADIWALGITAHQLLTGGLLAFPGATARARGAAAQAYADGQEQLRLADELPAAWRSFVADCLAPDHASRLPHTASSLAGRVAALRGAADAQPSAQPSAPPRAQPSASPRAQPSAPPRAKPSASPRAQPSAPPPAKPSASPRAEPSAPTQVRRRMSLGGGRRRVAALAAAAIAALATALALVGSGESEAPPPPGVELRVFNAEMPCRRSQAAECRLGLARDPYAKYAPANLAGRTRHGERLVAECYVPDATRVASEDGRSSTRWYRVRAGSGTAWLPGVRAWPGRAPAVQRC